MTLHHLLKGSLIFLLWSTGSEWHCTFCQRSSITSFPMINSKWVTLFCERQSHHIFSYDQQGVSDIATFSERQSHHIFSYDNNRKWVILHILWHSLITSFPMNNSKWVTLHVLWKVVSPHFSQQRVSDIADFVKGSLTVISFPLTNSLWVTCHIAHPVKGSLITSFSMINSLWVTFMFCER